MLSIGQPPLAVDEERLQSMQRRHQPGVVIFCRMNPRLDIHN
jgi:hypothetical protein